MLINIYGAKCIGIDAVPVTVEVDITRGLGIRLVGLADIAVKESLLRTITALQSIGFKIPGKKIVINLAPADMHKSGSGYDLPIALGIIAASGQCVLPDTDKYIIMGELGLDASLRPVSGALPMAELARRMGLKGCILPEASAYEAYDYFETDIYAARNLNEVLEILSGEDRGRYSVRNCLCDSRATGLSEPPGGGMSDEYMDFSEIIGQDRAKRALEIAASGNHNVIMIGAPGSGKSSLAKALAGILPEMSREESIVTSKIFSIAGKAREGVGLMKKRPFRAPHYSASLAAIIGGGNGENILPGEISLAQNGILFCDEFAQMPKSVTEALRGPLEDRKVVVSRLRAKVEFPSSFMLVAATNPCPCGYYGEGDRCTCTVGQRTSYLSRLSGPIMDRIDLQLWLHPVDPKKLVGSHTAESSAEVALRVKRAREMQATRFRDENIFTNSEMTSRMMRKYCPLSEDCKRLMEKIMTNMGLSARAFSRVIKLARTIADLAGEDNILPQHLTEAAGYRFLDKSEGIS